MQHFNELPTRCRAEGLRRGEICALDVDEGVKARPIEPGHVVEAEGLVQPVLMRLVVGQQHPLSNMREAVQTSLQQFSADAVPLILRVHQDVLDVNDRHVIAENSSKADQTIIVACSDDERGVLDAPREPVGVFRVGTQPTASYSVTSSVTLGTRSDSYCMTTDRNDTTWSDDGDSGPAPRSA